MTGHDDPRSDGTPGGGRRLEGSEYVDDTGAADPALAAALSSYAAAEDPAARAAAYLRCLVALGEARLLVPVVALLGESETGPHGLVTDKSSDMAAVLLTGRDGRTALLSFTSTDTLAGWDARARPVPVAARLAAQTAIQEGAAALLVDVAGPVRLVIEGDDLEALALGWRLARVEDDVVWVRPGPA